MSQMTAALTLMPIFIALTLVAVHLNRASYWMNGGVRGFWQDTSAVALASKLFLAASLLASLVAELIVSREATFAVVSILFVIHLALLLWMSMKK